MKTRLFQNPRLEVRRSSIHGWGVFAREKIEAGETLEECPFFSLDLSSPAMEPVRYYWPRHEPWEKLAVPSGFATLYNHSDEACADWETLEDALLFRFFAIRDIEADEEILIDYGEYYPW